MFANIKSRLTVKKAAVILTFALVITGSGLSSLASLSDTLNDTITFGTLSVNLKDGAADSSSIDFQNIDPSVAADFQQDLDLNNTGSASATVRLASSVSIGAGSDLDAAIGSAIFMGTCASGGTQLGGVAPYVGIAALDDSLAGIVINAGEHKPVCIKWHLTPNASMATNAITALYVWTATHP